MEIPWVKNRCILCVRENDLSEEHIIPDSIGGRLTVRFLCRDCNSNLGNEVEKAAKTDPSIRFAVEQLADKIPDLYSKLTDNQAHLGHSKAGRVSGFVRNSEFHVHPSKKSDGSLMQPTKQARKTIETILLRQGCTESQIAEAIGKFDQAPVDKRIEIYPGLESSKWSIESTELDFSKTTLMNPLIPLKIAFEFLACSLGDVIYSSQTQLDEIRQAFSQKDTESDFFRVDRLIAKKYQPFHGIVFEGNNPYAQVQIRLFGWLAFRVHFMRLRVHAPRFVYTHFLDTNVEDLRIVEKEA